MNQLAVDYKKWQMEMKVQTGQQNNGIAGLYFGRKIVQKIIHESSIYVPASEQAHNKKCYL